MKWLCYSKIDATKKIEDENKQKEKDERAKAMAIKLAEEEEAYKRYLETPEGKEMIAVMKAAEEERIAKSVERGRIAVEAAKAVAEAREAERVARELKDAVFREELLTRIGVELLNKSNWEQAYHFDHRLPKGTRFISVVVPVPSEYLGDFTKIGEFIQFVYRIIKEKYGKHPMLGGRVNEEYLGREWHEVRHFRGILVTIWDKNLSAV